MPDDQIPATAPNTPATTVAPLTRDNAAERSPAFTQTTNPTTTSHDPGDPGRPAICAEDSAAQDK